MLSSLFSNIVKKLKIPQYSFFDHIEQIIEDPSHSEIQKPSNYSGCSS